MATAIDRDCRVLNCIGMKISDVHGQSARQSVGFLTGNRKESFSKTTVCRQTVFSAFALPCSKDTAMTTVSGTSPEAIIKEALHGATAVTISPH